MVEVFGEEGQIFGCELVLQGLGCSGDNDSAARNDAGHEIGEGLARTGSGFDNEMIAFDD